MSAGRVDLALTVNADPMVAAETLERVARWHVEQAAETTNCFTRDAHRKSAHAFAGQARALRGEVANPQRTQ